MRKTATKRGTSAAAKPKKPKATAKSTADSVDTGTSPSAPPKPAAARRPSPSKAKRPAAKSSAKPVARKSNATKAKAASTKRVVKTGARRPSKAVTRVRPVAASKNGAVRRTTRRGRSVSGSRIKSVKAVSMPVGSDHRVMVKASLSAMKAVEATAKKLLGEITKRDKTIDKLKLTIAALQVSLKQERQIAKRRERDFERVLQRAEKAVNRTPSRTAVPAKKVRVAARKPKASFGEALAKHEPRAKKVAAAAAAKHAHKHARHAKLKELGKQVVESATQD